MNQSVDVTLQDLNWNDVPQLLTFSVLNPKSLLVPALTSGLKDVLML